MWAEKRCRFPFLRSLRLPPLSFIQPKNYTSLTIVGRVSGALSQIAMLNV